MQWQKRIDSANPTYGSSVTTDSSGNVFISGQEYNGGSNCGILIKLDSSGAILWQKRLRDSAMQDIVFKSVTTDSSGNSYVAGYSNYPYRVIVVKYNSSGTLQWQRTLAVSSSQTCFGESIKCDTYGNLYVGGTVNLTKANTLVLKLPVDGSGAGTYGSGTTFTYASSSFSDLTPSFSASSLGWTAAAPSLGTTAGDFTAASQTITNTKITVV